MPLVQVHKELINVNRKRNIPLYTCALKHIYIEREGGHFEKVKFKMFYFWLITLTTDSARKDNVVMECCVFETDIGKA
jgi:hypothetical protein